MGNCNEKIVVGEKSDVEEDKCSKKERDVWYKLYRRIGFIYIICLYFIK